jgi:hypothetical protein
MLVFFPGRRFEPPRAVIRARIFTVAALAHPEPAWPFLFSDPYQSLPRLIHPDYLRLG